MLHLSWCQVPALTITVWGHAQVAGAVAPMVHFQSLVQKCSTRIKVFLRAVLSPLQSKERQRRKRVVDQMILMCLLQSTSKFRILLYREYVSLHILGSFPKALYQSFSLVFSSKPLHLPVQGKSLHPVQVGGSAISGNSSTLLSDQRPQTVCGPSTHGTEPSLQMQEEDMMRSYVFQLVQQPQCFHCPQKKKKRISRQRELLLAVKSEQQQEKGFRRAILLFPLLSLFLIVLQL